MQFQSDPKHTLLPTRLSDALATIKPAKAYIARSEEQKTKPEGIAKSEAAQARDLSAILKIVESYPDNHNLAQTHGFLRGRFSPKEYEQMIKDGCIRVLRENEIVTGFISIFPWAHPLIEAERRAANLKIGPIGRHWIGEDYSPTVKRGNITYIAEAGVDPEVEGAGARLIRGLSGLRQEFPENYIVTTCSEKPISNLHSAMLVKKLGFERIGYVWLPFRPMNVGPYPGSIHIVTPFQSGIWALRPLVSA